MRIDQIINSPVDVAGRKHDTYSSSKAPSLGLLTKTLAGSPTIRWILPARIRHAQKDDLIFVGEDFIHLKEISEQGHLHHVATKADFGCCIMSAKILGNIDEDTLQTHIKTEDEEMSDGFCSEAKLPPQVLVLALESQQLVFVFASKDSSGNIQFDMASSIPLPVFTMPYQQLGKHLAVDPKSRAMAIAAPRNNIYLYSVRPMQRLHQGGAALGNKVLPVSTEGSLINVEGTILHMDFLFPPNDDTDHIVLLLIVMMNNRVALRRIDWLYASNLRATTLHDPQRLPKGYPLPTLLVPIESNNASFLLLSKASASIDIYENILAGYATQKHIAVPWQPPKNPGTSSKMPVWTAWARARRTSGPAQTRDCLYLASEDGWVYYITLNKQSPAQGVNANTVNHLGCDISSAFTCYGNVSQSDIFAVVGDLSQGGAHEVLMPSYDDQGSRLIEIFDNWTPTADVVASRLSLAHNSATCSIDSLFTVSNRRPYGKLSELRFGVEARIDPEKQILAEELRSADRVWTLPSGSNNELLLLLSSPTDSRLISIPAEINESTEMYFIDSDSDYALDLKHRTFVAAAIGRNGNIVQITQNGLFVTSSSTTHIQGMVAIRCSSDDTITAGDVAVEGDQAIAIVATRTASNTHLQLFRVDLSPGTNTLKPFGERIMMDTEVLGVAICTNAPSAFAVVSTSDSMVHLLGASPLLGLVPLFHHQLPESEESLKTCEDLLILSDDSQASSAAYHDLLVLCGLRNGQICTITLRSDRSDTQPLTIRSHRYTTVGLTTVRLRRDYSSTGCNAFATSGHDLLSIKWKGAGSEEPNVSKVWLTNATDPSFRQKSIAAFACVPDLDTYPVEFSCALVVISDGYGLITHVEDDIKVIPRSSPLQGSPDRTIYAPRIGCFVTASSKMTLRQFSPTRTTRCLQSVIEFTPTKRSSNAYTYEMAPGVQILSMMEWSYKTAGKEYAFVAVGSGAVGPADNESPIRGELTLLQPIVRNGIVCDVRTQKTIARYERNQSVTAIVAYGTLELAACVDKWLYLYRFLPEQTKFEEVCKYQFNSRGVSITAAPPLLHVTTAADSIITLELIESTVGGTRVTARADTLERYFRPIGMDTRSRKGLHHMTITTRQPAETSLERADAQSLTLNIMSTRNCEVVGFISPSINSRTHKKAMTTQFSAKLSRSQVRLREAHIRPPWKPDHAPGILEDRLIGFAVDGTITGLAILEPATAHRLRWVQRLCERSSIVCPWLPRHMNNDFQGEEDSDPYLMLPPLGFGYEATQTPRLGPEALAAQMHVDGDILQRLLLRGGVDLLKQMLEEEATRKDRLADWMRANLEKQMTMVEMMIAEVKSTIDRWI